MSPITPKKRSLMVGAAQARMRNLARTRYDSLVIQIALAAAENRLPNYLKIKKSGSNKKK